jgi:predicted transposase YdaD
VRLPEVLSLWYIMRQQEHALRYLEAIIRYVTAAGQHVKAEDVQAALNAVTPEGDAMIGSIAQEWIRQGEQRGEQRGLRLGLLDGIELGLELRFGLEGLRLLPEIAQIEDTYVLKAVHEAIRSVTRPEELRQFYAAGE